MTLTAGLKGHPYVYDTYDWPQGPVIIPYDSLTTQRPILFLLPRLLLYHSYNLSIFSENQQNRTVNCFLLQVICLFKRFIVILHFNLTRDVEQYKLQLGMYICVCPLLQAILPQILYNKWYMSFKSYVRVLYILNYLNNLLKHITDL